MSANPSDTEPSDAALLARLRALQERYHALELRVKALEAENETLLGRIQKLTGELAVATDRDRQQVLSLEIRRLQQQRLGHARAPNR